MKIGTKSLLFGVHQFIFHPIFVFLAWCELYKEFPTFKEFICIIIHDWGYFGLNDMDSKEGSNHSLFSAILIKKLFGIKEYNLILYHSRHYARKDNKNPSKLCWADKYSYKFDPILFYVIRANLSGEIEEYRNLPSNREFKGSDSKWYKTVRELYCKLALSQKIDEIPFQDEGI